MSPPSGQFGGTALAIETNIGGDGSIFVGEDKTLKLGPVFDGKVVLDGDGIAYVPKFDGSASTTLATCKDMAGWDVRLEVRQEYISDDLALPSKTATISGVFNASQLLTTQVAVVTFTDDELATLLGQVYHYSWKRMDSGSDTVLAYGTMTVQVSTVR